MLRMLQSTRIVSYAFELRPVAVERIDVLESKLKDQQEELETLRGQIGPCRQYFLRAESKTWNSFKLQWTAPLDSDQFALREDCTSVKVAYPGLYAVAVLVNHLPGQNSTGVISLQKNGIQVQSAATGASYSSYQGDYCSHHTSTSLMCIIDFKKDETIAVVCTNTSAIAKVPSYLTLARIGE
ncbi:unnamed protein product [Phytophthora lilii]|uniref:Unnamed protein product n=1 Tax=Phytophthora lilii TaxID=2077276 RepID=A0A9W7CMC4_9STRA|nr:unnamed protein product [Phytophthora lilii]